VIVRGCSKQRFQRGAWSLGLLSVLFVGCVQTQVRYITGPSGQAALFITCREAGTCYELAGRNCPTGYDLSPSKVDEHSVVVTCRQRQPSYARTSAPTPVAGYDYLPAPASELAPPVSDGWDPRHAPPPAPPPPQGEQASGMPSPRPIGAGGPDLGY
jgi:hypothetical protein